LTAAFVVGIAGTASAVPFTFFGANDMPSGTVSGDPLTQRNAFLGALSGGVGTEDFEGFALRTTTPLNLSFTGSTAAITATLSGAGTDIDTAGAGRFATSGSQFVETPGGGDFEITFDSAIAAFGFYGTDLGDVNNNLAITLTDTANVETTFTLATAGKPSGGLIFWGFVDTVSEYTKIAFDNVPGGGDVFGFDDMTIGDVNQIVNPPAVPLPAAGWMLLAALGGLGVAKRRKKA